MQSQRPRVCIAASLRLRRFITTAWHNNSGYETMNGYLEAHHIAEAVSWPMRGGCFRGDNPYAGKLGGNHLQQPGIGHRRQGMKAFPADQRPCVEYIPEVSKRRLLSHLSMCVSRRRGPNQPQGSAVMHSGKSILSAQPMSRLESYFVRWRRLVYGTLVARLLAYAEGSSLQGEYVLSVLHRPL